MPSWLKRLLRIFRYRYFRYMSSTLSLGPPLAGLLIALLLWLPAQMGEIYLGIFEEGVLALVRGAVALSCLALLSCLLFYWHLLLSTPRIGDIYQEYPDLHFDRNLLRVRNIKAAACASLPLVGVLLGLGQAYGLVDKTCENLTGALSRLNWEVKLGPDCATPLLYARLASLKLLAVGVSVLACAGFLLWAVPRLEASRRARGAILASASGLALVAIAGPILAPYALTVSIAWLAGPMVAILVVMTSAVTMLMGLSRLSQRIHFPIIGALLLLGVTFAALRIKGNVSIAAGVTATAGIETVQKAEELSDKARLQNEFVNWLQKRRPNPAEPYPVFLFAAEGGGIYAASAIALFLSALQDQCPQFARHVFAISAVSGGAVGATIFHALLNDLTASSSACAGVDGAQARVTATSAGHILRTDHLSPIVSLVLPDIFAKLFPLPRERYWDRAAALEWSLVCAFENRRSNAGAPSFCGHADSTKSRLMQPFDSHWQDAESPALVLNSTWVETGFRVAFAPKQMPLKALGDGTLYAFSDLPGADVGNVTLINAAVASARFPLIAPPWTLRHTDARVWNFVDGGYADSSGSTTALDLYKALDEVARKQNADLYLIVLTDALAAPDPRKINGSGFSDTVAPLSALLNVRAQLSSRAVTQTIDHFKPSDPKELVARSDDFRLMLVKLEQRSVPLTLGWKISRTEIDLVRLMLGSPELCRNEPPKATGTSETEVDIAATTATIVDNSCIKKRIVDLLSAPKPRPN